MKTFALFCVNFAIGKGFHHFTFGNMLAFHKANCSVGILYAVTGRNLVKFKHARCKPLAPPNAKNKITSYKPHAYAEQVEANSSPKNRSPVFKHD